MIRGHLKAFRLLLNYEQLMVNKNRYVFNNIGTVFNNIGTAEKPSNSHTFIKLWFKIESKNKKINK